MKYDIKGEPLPVVICHLDQGETLITESGAMSWMSPSMKMGTSGGGVSKMLGRMFSGESIFQNHYTAQEDNSEIAFASRLPGAIKAFEISPGNELIVQKMGFLASEKSVELSVFFQKKLSSGFFGGEGFIMQRLSGHGIAFVEFDGYCVEYQLAPGEKKVVDTGNLAAMSATCKLDIVGVPGIKNAIFGGEGLFNTVVTGPGTIYLQTMPLSTLAGLIIPYLPNKN